MILICLHGVIPKLNFNRPERGKDGNMEFIAKVIDDGKKDGHVRYRIERDGQFHEVAIPKIYVDNWDESQIEENIKQSLFNHTKITIIK